MIRKLALLALVGVGLFACKDDDVVGFDVTTEFQRLEFTPAPGGAVMSYYLPENLDIFGVRIDYVNAWGEPQTREASYLSDTLVIDGFTEARTAVPAQVCFFNRDMATSEPIDVTFDTEKSATVAVFDSLTVNPFWGGFNVTYTAPEDVNGIIHVFYIGTNPTTNEPDSILMSSVPITEGGDTLNFVPQQEMESIDVVVRTDSYDGKRVKQIVVEDVPCLLVDTLTSADFRFEFTGEIVEQPDCKIGLEYLMDGDKNGVGYYDNRRDGLRYNYSTFIAGPNAFYSDEYPQDNRFIVDLGEGGKVPAAVNLYYFLFFGGGGYPDSGTGAGAVASRLWSGYYATRLPAKIKLYGTNEDPRTVDLSTCALLYSMDEDVAYSSFQESWALRTDDMSTGGGDDFTIEEQLDGHSWLTKSREELENAEPVVLEMLCNYTGASYRYLIFVVTDTYCSWRWGDDYYEENGEEYITINELEVCVQAE